MSRRPLTLVGAVLAGSALVGATLAAAASLQLSPSSLTEYAAASAVPLSSCTLTASADAYVDSAVLSSGSNFGTATTLNVRSDVLGNRRTFARFDLSACPSFGNARVTDASLRLFLSTAPSASRTYNLHRVTAAWTETGVTSSNQPAAAAAATASVATGTVSAVTLSWPVTAEVQSFVDGTATNFGWRIRDATEDSLTARSGTFSARENGTAAQRPSLVVTYYP